MRNIIPYILLISIFVFGCQKEDTEEKVDTLPLTTEAQIAFGYLNDVRNNPSIYSEEIGVDLSDVDSIHPFNWNNKLANAAQKKAEDMATRNYFDHFTPEGLSPCELAEQEGYVFPEDWPDTDKYNYIESISGGSSKLGKEHIINLIFDNGLPHFEEGTNHRSHLLGMKEFWVNHTDIGIGFAYNEESDYKGYLVVFTGIQE
ncbi:MAG: hypothetical protein C0594_03520 [Marinilabiliales bacterium]|nr:MAG: hypothetical protein C0594_03520 [Marinilabiliales bacterium]